MLVVYPVRFIFIPGPVTMIGDFTALKITGHGINAKLALKQMKASAIGVTASAMNRPLYRLTPPLNVAG